ncbi:hypothetical protein [Sphingopyxis indica]|uniref:DUF2946 domain-containing protein n=1 Tax=Sphingopyxis indica TaxID=436663 RepID=A0A239ISW8_9SPHN|nr:hypothetical protein [Sphingopyxis indica]SNS96681.1 hypothetical protein SAMN06295955_108144 [Sphingopyxis indica]
MKRFLSLLLLIGALTGLLGQETAFASGPRASMIEMAAGAMSGDCMEMMQQGRQEPGKMPCKGLTLDCIAAMGCTIPLFAVPEPGTLGGSLHARQVHFLPAIHQLVGLSTGPEPPPPTA